MQNKSWGRYQTALGTVYDIIPHTCPPFATGTLSHSGLPHLTLLGENHSLTGPTQTQYLCGSWTSVSVGILKRKMLIGHYTRSRDPGVGRGLLLAPRALDW